MARALIVALLLGVVCATAGCGDDDADSRGATLPGGAVGADGSGILAGVRYRVVLFREMNVRIEPDRSIYRGAPPAGDRLRYMAVLRACNVTDEQQTPTADVVLEDAFGQAFEPQPAALREPFAFRARPLAPGRCMPSEGDPAARALDGTAIVYELPLRTVQDRPLVLELTDEGRRLRLPANPARP